MKQGLIRRASTLATALVATAGALVATAPAAVATHPIGCDNGDVQYHNPAAGFRVEVAREDAGTRVCYYTSQASGAYVVRDAGVLVEREARFDCVTYVPAVVGEPGDPVHASLRVGLDVSPLGATRFCVELGADAVTLTFAAAQAPAVEAHTPNWNWYTDDECRDAGVSDYAMIRAGDVEQDATVPVYFMLFPDPNHPLFEECTKARTRGYVVCQVVFEHNVVWRPAPSQSSCGLSPEANERVAELVALVAGLPGTVVEIAGGAVTLLFAEIEKVRQHPLVQDLEEEAGQLAGTVTTEVDRAVATVLEQVAAAQELVGEVVAQIPVEAGTDAGNCTRNVAAVGAVAVLRSADGVVPASVCVVAGTTVARVTIG